MTFAYSFMVAFVDIRRRSLQKTFLILLRSRKMSCIKWGMPVPLPATNDSPPKTKPLTVGTVTTSGSYAWSRLVMKKSAPTLGKVLLVSALASGLKIGMSTVRRAGSKDSNKLFVLQHSRCSSKPISFVGRIFGGHVRGCFDIQCHRVKNFQEF